MPYQSGNPDSPFVLGRNIDLPSRVNDVPHRITKRETVLLFQLKMLRYSFLIQGAEGVGIVYLAHRVQLHIDSLSSRSLL